MKNETSEEASKRVVNNSSLITAENSSTLQSKLHQRRNKLAAIKEKKYSNTALFENQKRDWSKKDKKKPKGGLYITAVTLSRFRETDLETKSTLQTTTNYSKNKNSRNNFLKKKSSLPYINKYSKNIGGHFFEYFENMGKNENINKDNNKDKLSEKKMEKINLTKLQQRELIHLLCDMFQSILVIVTSFLIYYYDTTIHPYIKIWDDVCGLTFLIIMIIISWPIAVDCIDILMEAAPNDLDIKKISYQKKWQINPKKKRLKKR